MARMLTKRRKDLIYLLTYIGYASIYMNRINLSMAGPDLKSTGILTTAQLGFLGTVFSVVYACGRLFNSLLADTVEPKKMIGIGLLGTGLAGILVGLLPPYAAILLLWGANAFAQSMLWASVLRIISALYPEDEVRLARLSVVASTVASGQLAGILLAEMLLNQLGLRWAFLVPGLFTLAMALLVFAFYPLVEERKETGDLPSPAADKAVPSVGASAGDMAPSDSPSAEKKRAGQKSASIPALLKDSVSRMAGLLKFPEIRLASVSSLFMGIMKDNATLWMTVYFVDTYGIDLNATTGFVLFVPIVGLLARLAYPVLFRATGNSEHRVNAASFAVSFAASIALVTVKNPIVAVVSLSLVYASMSLVNSSLLSIFPSRYVSKGCVAAVSGVMDFVAYLGAGLASTVFGLTIDFYGYVSMYMIWAVISVLGLLAARKLVRTKPEGCRIREANRTGKKHE